MGFYERLGVGRVINASTTFTALGGTLMPPEVLDAMRDAAGASVDMPGVTAHREPYNEAGQPVPRVGLDVDRARAVAAPETVVALLRTGDPAIAVLPNEVAGRCHGFWIGPDLLLPGEAEIVAAAIRRHLCRRPPARSPRETRPSSGISNRNQ